MADSRILAGTAATLSWQPVDSDGEAAAPDGAVTVGVTRADGTVLVAPGTATLGAGTAPRTLALTPAQTATLDILTATWTDAGGGTATTVHEVVGGYYFTIAEARILQSDLADPGKYPTATLVAARAQVEDEFESITNLAFVPRYGRRRVPGSGRCELVLRDRLVRTVRAVWGYSTATTYTAFDAGQLAAIVPADSGVIAYSGAFARGTDYVVAYEYGWDRPPGDIKRVALVRLREVVNESKSPIPSRASQFTSQEGTLVFATIPGLEKTGNPQVDAVLGRRRQPDAPF